MKESGAHLENKVEHLPRVAREGALPEMVHDARRHVDDVVEQTGERASCRQPEADVVVQKHVRLSNSAHHSSHQLRLKLLPLERR